MLTYKFDVLAAIKATGLNTSRIRETGILSESSVQKLRTGVMVSTQTLDVICSILDMQPGDIIQYESDSRK